MKSNSISEIVDPATATEPRWQPRSQGVSDWLGAVLQWSVSLGLIGIASITLLKRHIWRDGLHFFWDLKVYVATIQAQVEGLDPYARTTLGHFGVSSDYLVTTPPVATWLLGLLGTSCLRDHTVLLLGALHLAALGVTVSWSASMFFGRGTAKLALAAAAYLGLFAGTGMVSLGAGNLGTALHALVLLSLGQGFMAGRWRAGFASILVASVFKPFYLAYLLVPVAAHGWSWRLARLAALTCTLTICCYLAQAWLAPDAFAAWMRNVHYQVMEFGDIGSNLLGIRALAGYPWILYEAQVLGILAFVASAVLGSAKGRARWAVLLLAALFVNPRIMPYDLAVASVPLAYLVAGFMPASLGSVVSLPLSVGGLALLQVSSYYPTGLDPHWEFPLTALMTVVAASIPVTFQRRQSV